MGLLQCLTQRVLNAVISTATPSGHTYIILKSCDTHTIKNNKNLISFCTAVFKPMCIFETNLVNIKQPFKLSELFKKQRQFFISFISIYTIPTKVNLRLLKIL